MDKDTFEITCRIVLALIGLGLIWLIINVWVYIEDKLERFKTKKDNGPYVPNGEGKNLPLGSLWGTGLSLCGDFYRDYGPKISYYCFTILTFPIIPFKCLRVDQGKSHIEHKPLRTSVTPYTIYGTDNWSLIEVILLYLRALLTIGIIFGVLLYIDKIIMVDSDLLFDLWIDICK